MKKLAVLLFSSLLLMSALAGCGTQNIGDKEGEKSQLIVAQAADVSALDPQLSNAIASVSVYGNIFDTLTKMDENNQVIPHVAESWEQINDTTTVFHIRRDVTFSNGEALTSEDVVYTIERVITFTTSVMIRPLDLGADVVVNSLTKFYNGHSDCLAGSVTSTKAIIKGAYDLQVLLGTNCDAFTSWMVLRSIRTLDIRVKKQMENAAALAAALEKNPHIARVIHPSLISHPQHELAKEQFNGYGAMLSIIMKNEDREKMNAFMRRLRLVRYAMTLGGFRTTMAHPVTSSHADLSEEERQKLGITFGLLRISVGMENVDDLIHDFNQALTVYDS